MTPEDGTTKVDQPSRGAPRPEEPKATEKPPSPSQEPQAEDVPPPPPVPQFAEIPEGGSRVGENKAIALEALSSSGHWVAYCHPQQGENMPTTERGDPKKAVALFLQIGDKKRAIDALLAHDQSGRYVVIFDKGSPLLIDTIGGHQVDLLKLSPDLRADAIAEHRSFAFSSRGLVVLADSEKPQGHLLPLPLKVDSPPDAGQPDHLSSAVPLRFGERPVWRIEAQGSGIAAITVPKGSSPKAWPVPHRELPTHRCAAPSRSYSAYARESAYRPDPSLNVAWLNIPAKLKSKQTLRAQPAPGYVMSFQDGWVRRQDDGRTLFVRRGTQKQIASSNCGGRILHADPKTGLFFVSCEEYRPVLPKKTTRSRKKKKPKYRFDLYLIKPGFVRSLKADTMRTGVDVAGNPSAAFVPFRPGADAALVDLKKRSLTRLAAGSFVLGTGPRGALVRRGNKLHYWTPQKEKELEKRINALSPVLTADSAVAIDKEIYLLGSELETWTIPAPPLALSPSGYALITATTLQPGSWPQGPLVLVGPPDSSKATKASESPTPPPPPHAP